MKEKKLKISTWVINILLLILDMVVIVYNIVNNNYDRMVIAALLYPTMFIPYLLDKTKYRISYKYKFLYSLFMFFGYFLGSIINLYDKIFWYDLFVHAMSGVFTLILAYYILNNSKSKNTNGVIKFLYCIGFVALVAVSWEIIEFIVDNVFSLNTQHNLDTGVADTMGDMIAGLFGGLIGYIFLKREDFKD